MNTQLTLMLKDLMKFKEQESKAKNPEEQSAWFNEIAEKCINPNKPGFNSNSEVKDRILYLQDKLRALISMYYRVYEVAEAENGRNNSKVAQLNLLFNQLQDIVKDIEHFQTAARENYQQTMMQQMQTGMNQSIQQAAKDMDGLMSQLFRAQMRMWNMI